MISQLFKLSALSLALLCAGITNAHAQVSRSLTDDRNLSVQRAANPQPRISAQRVALVIGNASYKEAPLVNPVNDARAIAKALADSGFTVILRENADQRGILSALREFGDKLSAGGTGLFYYAGHGMQIKGRNYLIPVGASIEREDEVAYGAVDAQAVLDKMEAAGNGANIMILDACRNNPFTRSTRSGQAGLAQMDAPVGTLVAFATSPGAVASDGAGSNGLYTQHLLDAMRKEGSKVEDVFKQVRANVRRDSQGKQVPWEATSLEGDFYFRGGAAVAAFQTDIEQALWEAVKDSSQIVELRAYLNRHPSGRYSELALERIARLQPVSASIAAAAPISNKPQLNVPPAQTVRLNPKIGDTVNYINVNLLTGNQTNTSVVVSAVASNGDIQTNQGAQIYTAAGAIRYVKQNSQLRERFYEGDLRNNPSQLKIGFKESINYRILTKTFEGKTSSMSATGSIEVLNYEKVQTPAGNFMAWLTSRQVIATLDNGSKFRLEVFTWFVPELNRFVASEFKEFSVASGKLTQHEKIALNSFIAVDSSAQQAIASNIRTAQSLPEVSTFLDTASLATAQQAVDKRTEEILAQLTKTSASAPSPISRPTAMSNAQGYTVGDRWRYHVVDKFKGEVVRNYDRRIQALSGNEVIFSRGNLHMDSSGNFVLSKNSERERRLSSGAVRIPAKLELNFKQDIDYTYTDVPLKGGSSTISTAKGSIKVVGREMIRTPAGEFLAWKIEHEEYWQEKANANNRGRHLSTGWYVPELREFVAFDEDVRGSGGEIIRRERHELTSYSVRGADEALAKR
jgi:hypothetical protein